MATHVTCDRCLQPTSEVQRVEVEFTLTSNHKSLADSRHDTTFDLCTACSDQIRAEITGIALSDWYEDDNFDAGLEAEQIAEDEYRHEIAVADAMADSERADDDRRRDQNR